MYFRLASNGGRLTTEFSGGRDINFNVAKLNASIKLFRLLSNKAKLEIA